MMKRSIPVPIPVGALLLSTAVAASLGLASCERPRMAAPIVEEPTASALRDVSASALEHVRAAIPAVQAGAPGGEAVDELRASEATLLKLTEYYVPLLDAHERSYRAYRLYYAEPSRVESELERIETLLHDVVRDRGSEVEGPVDEALGMVEDVRSSMAAHSPAAAHHLDELARKLSFMLLKAELILRQ
jgi:hypothetical protein